MSSNSNGGVFPVLPHRAIKPTKAPCAQRPRSYRVEILGINVRERDYNGLGPGDSEKKEVNAAVGKEKNCVEDRCFVESQAQAPI